MHLLMRYTRSLLRSIQLHRFAKQLKALVRLQTDTLLHTSLRWLNWAKLAVLAMKHVPGANCDKVMPWSGRAGLLCASDAQCYVTHFVDIAYAQTSGSLGRDWDFEALWRCHRKALLMLIQAAATRSLSNRVLFHRLMRAVPLLAQSTRVRIDAQLPILNLLLLELALMGAQMVLVSFQLIFQECDVFLWPGFICTSDYRPLFKIENTVRLHHGIRCTNNADDKLLVVNRCDIGVDIDCDSVQLLLRDGHMRSLIRHVIG